MQTFLPVPDFWGSATLLDRQRLGKQRVENYQIMQALTGLAVSKETGEVEPYEAPASITKHWVTAMWRGHELALWEYQREVIAEWLRRGYHDTCWEKTNQIYRAAGMPGDRKPEWLGDPKFYTQHQGRLVAKDPVIYRELFPGVEPIEDYTFEWRR